MTGELMTLPARQGRACRLNKGQAIKIINTHGHQVVDTWAFSAEDLHEFMSNEHLRPTIGTIFPTKGHHLHTNRRRPILFFEEDTSPGIHDTLMAACDDYRYGLLGCKEYHDNCTDNLIAGMRQIGLDAAGSAEPAQSVDEHSGCARTARPAGASPCPSPATMSCCAPRWIASSPCRPARRTSCRSTRARPSRRTTRFFRAEETRHDQTTRPVAERRQGRRRHHLRHGRRQPRPYRAPAAIRSPACRRCRC